MSGYTAAAFILLLIAPALQAQAGWSVTYANSHICAVRGSTVTISCTFTHPSELIVESTFWFRDQSWLNDLRLFPEYSGRVESICDQNNRCALTIRNLRESDSDVYKFRIITNTEKEKWIGQPGVSLTVTDLPLIRSYQYLSCGNCSQTRQPGCKWSKNGEKILENFYYYSVPKEITSPDDNPCTRGGGGNPGETDEVVTCSSRNICAFQGSTVHISCKHSIWPSAWATFWTRNDSDVDLSSNSLQSYRCTQETIYEFSTNPDKYYNYKDTLTIRNVRESDSAVYKIWINPGGDRRSTGGPGVRLTVLVSEPELQIHVRRPTAEQSQNQTELTCVSQCGDSLHPSYVWYKNNEALQGETGSQVVLQCRAAPGRYSCALSAHQTFRSPAVYAPEGPSVSASPSAEVEESTSVTLSCSSDAQPAAHYSWFKEGEESARSAEQNFTITHVRAEDSGTYSCHVWNLMGHNQSRVEVTVVKVSSSSALLLKPEYIGSAVGIFLVGLIGVVIWLVKKKARQKPSVTAAARKQDPSSQLEEDNLQYASICFSKEPTDLYSNTSVSAPLDLDPLEEGGDAEYSNVRMNRARTTGAAGTEDSSDVIYSSVK